MTVRYNCKQKQTKNKPAPTFHASCKFTATSSTVATPSCSEHVHNDLIIMLVIIMLSLLI